MPHKQLDSGPKVSGKGGFGDIFVPTVDGGNPANQLRLVVYPIIYREFYIPGGAGFLSSTVWCKQGKVGPDDISRKHSCLGDDQVCNF